MKAIREIYAKIPTLTGSAFVPAWERLLSSYPTTLDAIPQESLPEWQMPALQGATMEMPKHISEKLKEFNETIHYTNPIAGVCVVHRARACL
jgi:urea transporter